VLWLLAWLRLPAYVGIGVFASFVSDVLDGYVARRLGQVSEMGSQLDSLADNILIPSAVLWLWMFRPEVFREHPTLLLIALTLYCASMILGLVKFRRFGNLHLYSSKVAAVPMYLFFTQALIAAHYSSLLFYLALGTNILSDSESVLLELIHSQVDEHMGSLLPILRRGRS
jgi:phosphatidylserine synthase